MPEKYFFIINPVSGNKKAIDIWYKLSVDLVKSVVDYEYEFTKHRSQAEEIAIKSINNGFRKIIVIGGDGTMNEVLNGLMQVEEIIRKQTYLGMIPVGTGNDWCRTFKIPFDSNDAWQIISGNHSFLQDIGSVEYHIGGQPHKRYFINVAGLGFDGMVAKRVNNSKEGNRSGKLIYLFNLLGSLVKYKSNRMTIKSEDSIYSEVIFSLSAGIGKYNGGGMMQLPEAVPDDGLLDITMIKNLTKLDVIKNVRNLFDGSFISHPAVTRFRCKELLIESTEPLELEADGESLGDAPYRFGIIPGAVYVFSPLGSSNL